MLAFLVGRGSFVGCLWYTLIVFKYLIGIDEAGRGPLAGPVAVGVALVPLNFNWDLILNVGDSKQVSPKKREEIFKRALELQKEGKLNFAVVMISAKIIDKIGIVPSIQKAMNEALKKIHRLGLSTAQRKTLCAYSEYLVKLDGGLKAPKEYVLQETIIKGDSKEKVIGLASIMAKVTRDHYMVKQGNKTEFELYGFEIHKGYGTKVHRAKIAQFGLSTEHRATFCKNVKVW